MTYEPLHSAQAQSVRVNEKISFGFVGHHCRDITRREDKCTFYPYFRVKSLRFELQVNIQLGKHCSYFSNVLIEILFTNVRLLVNYPFQN